MSSHRQVEYIAQAEGGVQKSVIVSQSYLILAQHDYKYVYDLMSERDKRKLVTLCHELIRESQYKIHQTDRLRDMASRRLGFQVGMIIGQIREKYKMMLELYRGINNKYTGKSKVMLPKISTSKPVHFIWRMEYISSLEIDIDRLVHLLEQIPLDDSTEDNNQPTNNNNPGRMKILRTGERSQESDMLRALKEDQLKRSYRQEFLRSRLGLSADTNMDTYAHMDNQ